MALDKLGISERGEEIIPTRIVEAPYGDDLLHLLYSEHYDYGFPRIEDDYGLIYVARCNEFVKIGMSKNPVKRLHNLQIAIPYHVKIEAIYRPLHDLTRVCESNFHKFFKKYRVTGEWFSDDVMRFIYPASNANVTPPAWWDEHIQGVADQMGLGNAISIR